MEEVIDNGNVFVDLEARSRPSKYKIQILKRSGGKITLSWNKFKSITVSRFMRLKNIDEDYIVIIKD